MKKIVLIAALIGFLVALSLGVLGSYMYHHGMYNRPSPAVMLTRRVVLWVWPTAAMLVDADENLRGVVAFIVCSIANGIIYGAVAFCLASGWKSLFKNRQIHNF